MTRPDRNTQSSTGYLVRAKQSYDHSRILQLYNNFSCIGITPLYKVEAGERWWRGCAARVQLYPAAFAKESWRADAISITDACHPHDGAHILDDGAGSLGVCVVVW